MIKSLPSFPFPSTMLPGLLTFKFIALFYYCFIYLHIYKYNLLNQLLLFAYTLVLG